MTAAAANPIRVLLVDDDPAFATLVSTVLELEGLIVIGHARDGVEGIQLAVTLEPDVIVMDVHMPRLDGMETTRRLVDRDPAVRVLVVSSTTEPDAARQAADAGAAGYLPKDRAAAELAAEVQQAHAGRPTSPARAGSRSWAWRSLHAFAQ